MIACDAVRSGEVNAAGDKVRESRVVDVLQAVERELRWDATRPTGQGRGVAVDIRHVGFGKTSMLMRLLPTSGQVEVLTGMGTRGLERTR